MNQSNARRHCRTKAEQSRVKGNFGHKGRERGFMASSGNIWYGKLMKDVVHIHRRVPKKPGSTKLKTTSTAQDSCLSMRWLELSCTGVEGGVLYEWHDGGTCTLDDTCPEGSVLCLVGFVSTVCSDGMGEHFNFNTCCSKKKLAA